MDVAKYKYDMNLQICKMVAEKEFEHSPSSATLLGIVFKKLILSSAVSTHICRARCKYDIRISLLRDLLYLCGLEELLDFMGRPRDNFAASGVPCMSVEDEFENGVGGGSSSKWISLEAKVST